MPYPSPKFSLACQHWGEEFNLDVLSKEPSRDKVPLCESQNGIYRFPSPTEQQEEKRAVQMSLTGAGLKI